MVSGNLNNLSVLINPVVNCKHVLPILVWYLFHWLVGYLAGIESSKVKNSGSKDMHFECLTGDLEVTLFAEGNVFLAEM